MPKEIKQYQCEICGAVYDDEEDAVDCESQHLRISAVHSKLYGPGAKLPSTVYLKMSNGTIVRYECGRV